MTDRCPECGERPGRRFPVLAHRFSRGIRVVIPVSVPWALVARHEAQAVRNHHQSLERLAERGGLAPQELWCVVNDRPWSERCGLDAAIAWTREVA